MERFGMNCQQIQRWLSADADGAAAPERRTAVAAHVERCADCRAFAEGLAPLSQVLTSFAAPEPSTGFAHRTVNRIDKAKDRRAWPQLRPELLRPVPVGIAVAAFAFGVALTWLANGVSTTSVSTVASDDPFTTFVGGSDAASEMTSVDDAMLSLFVEGGA